MSQLHKNPDALVTRIRAITSKVPTTFQSCLEQLAAIDGATNEFEGTSGQRKPYDAHVTYRERCAPIVAAAKGATTATKPAAAPKGPFATYKSLTGEARARYLAENGDAIWAEYAASKDQR